MRAAGFSDEDMHRWHAEFEKKAPAEHQEFLEFLHIPREEVNAIREWSGRWSGRAGRLEGSVIRLDSSPARGGPSGGARDFRPHRAPESKTQTTGRSACATKSLFLCAPRRFFASVPCTGRPPKTMVCPTGGVCGIAALCYKCKPPAITRAGVWRRARSITLYSK